MEPITFSYWIVGVVAIFRLAGFSSCRSIWVVRIAATWLLDFVAAVKKVDKDRMSAIKASGCILCLLASGKTQAPDIHHLTSGSLRRGHQYTIAACPYHHRGLIPDKHTKQSMSGLLGPSYAWGRRGFREFFGSDDLLLKVQNLVLEHFKADPWIDYIVPHDVRREAKELWSER